MESRDAKRTRGTRSPSPSRGRNGDGSRASSRSPTRWTAESKATWYLRDPDLAEEPELQLARDKYCRCQVQSAYTNLRKNGVLTRNAYAICNASVARANAGALGATRSGLASSLSRLGQSGACTTWANLETMPTDMLWALATMRTGTTKGRAFFAGQVPTPEEYLGTPEGERDARYRGALQRAIGAYRNADTRGPAERSAATRAAVAAMRER